MDPDITPEFDLVKLLGQKPTHKYSRDEMYLMRDRPASLIYPDELKAKTMPSSYQSLLWDPEVWWMSLMDRKESEQGFKASAPGGRTGSSEKRKESYRRYKTVTSSPRRSPSPIVPTRMWPGPNLHPLLAPVHSPLLGYSTMNPHWASSFLGAAPSSTYVPWSRQEALRTYSAALAHLPPGTSANHPTYHLDLALRSSKSATAPSSSAPSLRPHSSLDSTMTPPRTTLAPSGPYAALSGDPTEAIPRKAWHLLVLPTNNTGPPAIHGLRNETEEFGSREEARKAMASRNLQFSTAAEKESKIRRLATELAKLLVVEKDKAAWLYRTPKDRARATLSHLSLSQSGRSSIERITRDQRNVWAFSPDITPIGTSRTNFSKAPGTPVAPRSARRTATMVFSRTHNNRP